MRYLVAIMLIFLVAGCSSGSNMTTNSQATLYSAGGGSILRVDHAALANGNVMPSVISGPATLLGAINGIVVDEAANRLFVGSQGATPPALLIFDNASTKTGNVPPDRVVTGSATMLTLPLSMVLDQQRNILYVADGNNILIFSNASTMNGNVAPSSTLTAPFITFVPGGLALDAANDRLFVSNPNGNEVISFDHASQLGPVPTGSRLISGPNTGLAEPQALALDRNGRLLVSNILGGITIYANAGGIAGDTAPVATIQGPNTQSLSGIAMGFNGTPGGADSGDLYVLDSNTSAGEQKVLVFANIGSASATLAPARTFALPASTGNLSVLALDTTR